MGSETIDQVDEDGGDELTPSETVTYCPEDNKLRLYVGRVERAEYERLRKGGWVSTPKQECDFVAVWSSRREDHAREYLADGEDIGDEDYSPQERAADRAERFAGYREKRRAEAGGLADQFDAGPAVFGHQSQAKADRAAARHDRTRGKAVSQWEKAEYWQERTAGVIRSALYKSSPKVRRGRILEIEKEIRAIETKYTPRIKKGETEPQQIMQHSRSANYLGDGKYDREPEPHVYCGAGRGGEWVAVASLERLKAAWQRTLSHLRMRREYELAMIGDEGGMVSEVEIEPGGWFGEHQVHKVNKSPSTGRVTSVAIRGKWGYTSVNGRRVYVDHANAEGLALMNIERLGEDAYRPPTDEEREEFKKATAAAKKKAKASKPAAPKLINPTDEDAERLQGVWNERARERHAKTKQYTEFKPSTVFRMTQAQYSERSKGSYASLKAKEIGEKLLPDREAKQRRAIFKARTAPSSSDFYAADRVVILIDKPQKPIPWDAAAEFLATQPTFEAMLPQVEQVAHALAQGWQRTDEQDAILSDAAYAGLIYKSHANSGQWTDEGREAYHKHLEAKRAEEAEVEAEEAEEAEAVPAGRLF
jgi:hypothetical protein